MATPVYLEKSVQHSISHGNMMHRHLVLILHELLILHIKMTLLGTRVIKCELLFLVSSAEATVRLVFSVCLVCLLDNAILRQ